MFSVIITDQTGQRVVRVFEKPNVSVGRDKNNDVVLLRSNVSKQHARILQNRGAFVVIDNKSTNGTFVNGARIDSPYVLQQSDKIFVGDFILEVTPGGEPAQEAPPEKKKKKNGPRAAKDEDAERADDAVESSGRPPHPPHRSPVAVNWEDDWESPVDPAPDAAAARLSSDSDLDFDPLGAGDETTPADDPGTDPSAPERARRGKRVSTVEQLAECLREYVELDVQYRARAIGGRHGCDCGECLLCRARRAVERFDDGER